MKHRRITSKRIGSWNGSINPRVLENSKMLYCKNVLTAKVSICQMAKYRFYVCLFVAVTGWKVIMKMDYHTARMSLDWWISRWWGELRDMFILAHHMFHSFVHSHFAHPEDTAVALAVARGSICKGREICICIISLLLPHVCLCVCKHAKDRKWNVKSI